MNSISEVKIKIKMERVARYHATKIEIKFILRLMDNIDLSYDKFILSYQMQI